MSDILLAPDVRPFAIAAAIMVVLGGIELLTTLVGFSISTLLGPSSPTAKYFWKVFTPITLMCAGPRSPSWL